MWTKDNGDLNHLPFDMQNKDVCVFFYVIVYQDDLNRNEINIFLYKIIGLLIDQSKFPDSNNIILK